MEGAVPVKEEKETSEPELPNVLEDEEPAVEREIGGLKAVVIATGAVDWERDAARENTDDMPRAGWAWAPEEGPVVAAGWTVEKETGGGGKSASSPGGGARDELGGLRESIEDKVAGGGDVSERGICKVAGSRG